MTTQMFKRVFIVCIFSARGEVASALTLFIYVLNCIYLNKTFQVIFKNQAGVLYWDLKHEETAECFDFSVMIFFCIFLMNF